MKPWGFEILYAHTLQYAGKVIFIKKGQRLSLQYHEKKDETIYVYSGKILLETKGTITMCSGDMKRILPNTKHRIVALDNTTILEVSTSELDDIVRIKDDYGRC